MKNFILGFLMATVLLAGGYFAYSHWSGKMAGGAAEQAKIRYHCPMHPTYISDKPGDCPICGMKLVPMEPVASPDPHAGHQSTAARLSPGQTAAAEPAVSGYMPVTIPQDRHPEHGNNFCGSPPNGTGSEFTNLWQGSPTTKPRIHHVHTKFDGYIETLYANYVGQFVKKGEPLFSIYSPELYATQNEYLLALRAREQMPPLGEDDAFPAAGNIDLVAAARQRLALWDIGENDISRTRKNTQTHTGAHHLFPGFGLCDGKKQRCRD